MYTADKRGQNASKNWLKSRSQYPYLKRQGLCSLRCERARPVNFDLIRDLSFRPEMFLFLSPSSRKDTIKDIQH